MSTVHQFRPKLTAHGQFMRDFVAADTPCFALGVVEERRQQLGFLGLRLDEIIPPDVAAAGFGFGHSLLGTDNDEVIHFAFDFYGFQTYNVLINPNTPLVQHVLDLLISRGDYFVFVLDSDRHATAFRAEISEDNLAGLRANLPRVQRSTTTDVQYRRTISAFQINPRPEGTMLNWVCRDNIGYLDIARDPLDLTPS